VVFTDFAANNQQWLFYTGCAAGCTSGANWATPMPAQSQPVGAHTTDPYVVSSAVTRRGSCLYAYYHGTEVPNAPGNEIAWGTNSCDGWAATARDQVTTGASRAIYLTLTASDGYLHLAYQQISGTDSTRHIFHLRGALPADNGGVYLPLIRR
jgi:hypothetical protein